MNTRQSGITISTIIVGVMIIAVAVFAGMYVKTNTKEKSKEVACTLEAQLCPDGSSVGRVPPSCEFSPCPTAQPSPQFIEPTPHITGTAGWKTHELFDNKSTIKYPPAAVYRQQDVYASFYMHGPTQSLGTEVYDGFILNMTVAKLNGKTVNDIIEEKAALYEQIEEPIHPYSLNGMAGFKFRARSLGDFNMIILKVGNSQYLEITELIEDPTKQGFRAQVDTMLSTLKVNLTDPTTTNPLGYTCPTTEWVDCMPGPDRGNDLYCEQDYLSWAKESCPGFKGAAY